MARRYKRSQVWSHPRISISTMILQPDCYYMEEEVEISEIREMLCDASYEEWFQMYLNYYKRYRPELPRTRFYTKGFSVSGDRPFFLMKESFFQNFLEAKWYCRLSSLANIENYLEPTHYTNEIQFKKSFTWLKSLQSGIFPECRFYQFKFYPDGGFTE